MKFSPAMQLQLLQWTLLFSSTIGAQIIVNYDKSLEGRVSEQVLAKEVIGKVFGDRKTQPNLHAKNDVEARDITPSISLNELFGKRQGSYCPAGYAYCQNFGRCCPTNDRCCSYGYCIDPADSCCPNGPCRNGQECCGANHCNPVGAECCRDGSHCDAGNHCYLDPQYGPVCCTNNLCTAYVKNGVTTSATTSTYTNTYTITSTQYYYWTVTWYYYYYFWTYSYDIKASVVTSTLSTTSSTLSVRTTDAAAASDYFSSVSQTLSLPTPAAATSLETLAGKTSHATAPADTTDSGPSQSATAFSGGSGGGNGNSGGGGGSSKPPSSGDDKSGAMSLWSAWDRPTAIFLSFGVFAGVLAAVL